jgi:membrane-associated PAP2 superfamily phosphatase
MNRTGLVIALAVAAVVGVVFGLRPDLDLKLAGLFFDPERGGFWRAYDPPYLRARDAATWVITLVAMPAVVALAFKLIRPQRPLLIPGRAVVLMLVTLALAPGVVATSCSRSTGAGRGPSTYRVRGHEHFRPWWDPRGDCPKNCSFVAGEPSGAFWTLAPAAVVPQQWRALAYGAALTFGAAVGLLRMVAGAHFFSDVVFAGVFSFLVIWLVHGSLYRWGARGFPTRRWTAVLERMTMLQRATLKRLGFGRSRSPSAETHGQQGKE